MTLADCEDLEKRKPSGRGLYQIILGRVAGEKKNSLYPSEFLPGTPYNKRWIEGWVWWLMPVIPTLWEAEAGKSSEVGCSRSAWPTWQNPFSTKNIKISWAWWHVPVVSATREAKPGEPGR